MNELIQTFNFGINEIRTAIKDNGDVYFCLTDVADVLEISNANPSRFSLDEAGVHKMYISYPSGSKQVTFVNEPNLYRVIFRSNKEQAEQFQDWVFNEVLPTIRKTGAYVSEPPQPVQPVGEVEDKIRAIKFVLDCSNISSVAKETALITSVETLTGVCIGYRPKIERTTYSAKEVGDMLGISANRVGRIANAHGLKTEEYGLYYLNKSQHSDKQVEHFRYFESAIDKFKAILGDE